MVIFRRIFVFVFTIVISINVLAQDDMLSLLDSVAGGKKTHEKVIAIFKDSKIINAQTIETVKAKTMNFNITHRFGNIGVSSNGGVHTLYGLDNVTDVRFGFDFGITDKITLGIGRSKQSELVDASLKYRLLSQTIDNHVPFSLALYGDMGYTPTRASQFYNGIDPNSDFHQKDIQRISYVGQLILARKFGWRFSMELLPTFHHRNYVLANINPNNNAEETNDLISIGGGFRFKITQRVAIVADYFYTLSDYRTNNPVTVFNNPFAVGVEIDTGGHIFHLDFTNASGIVENNFIPNTTDNWLKGGYKFGFNISRVFNMSHKKH